MKVAKPRPSQKIAMVYSRCANSSGDEETQSGDRQGNFKHLLGLHFEHIMVIIFFIWLMVWNIFYLSIYWEFHNPN